MPTDIESVNGSRQHRRPPYLLEFRSSNGFILATVCVAIFTDAFLYGVVVPVLPFSLHDRSGVPENEVQWWNSFIFAVFGAAILIGSPICGWVADQTSDRSVTYFVGLFILAAATLLFGIAKAAWILVVSRILQGLSAAIVYTVGLALLVDTVGSENIGQWMGTALSSSSFGLIVSPLLGGIVYNKAGYLAVFAMALGLIIVDIVMRMSMIEKRSAAKYLTQDSATSNRNLFTDSHTHQNGNRSSNDIARNSSNTAEDNSPTHTAGRPEAHERTALLTNHTGENGADPSKIKRQLPPVITLLGSARFLAAIYGIFVNVSILATFDAVLPLFVKATFHWNSLAAGLIFLCIAIPALAGPLVGKLSDHFGPRWIAVIGCSLTAVPLVLMRLVEKESLEQEILLCGLLIISGCTLILIVAPVAADLSAVVEEMEAEQPGIFGPGGAFAQAFALFNCSMAAATLFGPVVAGTLIQNYGWKTLTLAMGIFSFSGAIPSFFFTGGWLFESKNE